MACIFVVLTHSITDYLTRFEVNLTLEAEYIIWIRFALLCATPIFILISEMLIAMKYPFQLPKGFFKKRIRFIIIPYLFIGLVTSYKESNGDGQTFWSLAIEKILIGNWYGFFIIVIFQFYILHWLIGKYLAKVNPVYPIILSFIISFTHIFLFENNIAYKNGILTYYPLFYRTNLLIWLFYFVVAFYIGRYYVVICNFLKNKIWLPLIAVIGSYLYLMYNVIQRDYVIVASERYDILIYTISVFFLVLILCRKYKYDNGTLIMISQFSYFIYLTHMLVLVHLGPMVLQFGHNFFLYILSVAFFTLSTSIGWAWLFYYNKYTRHFTGKIPYIEEKIF